MKSIIAFLCAIAMLCGLLCSCSDKSVEIQPDSTTVATELTYEGFSIQLDSDRKELPERKTAEQITENMTISEVYSLMGKPQRDVGSGLIILEWDLNTADTLQVVFTKDYAISDGYRVMKCSIYSDSET